MHQNRLVDVGIGNVHSDSVQDTKVLTEPHDLTQVDQERSTCISDRDVFMQDRFEDRTMPSS